jgi:hypothetical protein
LFKISAKRNEKLIENIKENPTMTVIINPFS